MFVDTSQYPVQNPTTIMLYYVAMQLVNPINDKNQLWPVYVFFL